jgi:hypothetical protein
MQLRAILLVTSRTDRCAGVGSLLLASRTGDHRSQATFLLLGNSACVVAGLVEAGPGSTTPATGHKGFFPSRAKRVLRWGLHESGWFIEWVEPVEGLDRHPPSPEASGRQVAGLPTSLCELRRAGAMICKEYHYHEPGERKENPRALADTRGCMTIEVPDQEEGLLSVSSTTR